MSDAERRQLERRVLVLDSDGVNAAATCELLTETGAACAPCPDVAALCRELELGAGAVLMAEEMLRGEENGSLSRALCGQPEWSDLPVVVVADREEGESDFPRGRDLRDAPASRIQDRPGEQDSTTGEPGSSRTQSRPDLGNVLVIERPVGAAVGGAALLSAVRSSLRARDRQYQLRDRLVERDLAEAALRASEARLSIMFNYAEDPVAIYPLMEGERPGRFIEVNDAMVRRYGYSREQLLRMSPGDLVDPSVDVAQWMEDLRAGGTVLRESLHIAADGRKVPVEVNSHLFELRGRSAVLSIIRDLTKRKQAREAERRLRRETEAARAKLSNILESITDAFFSLDREGRFTYINRRAEQLWGGDRERLLGMTLAEAFPEAAGSESQNRVLRALYEREPIEYETFSPVLHRWVQCHVYPSEEGISVYLHDISERKRAEASLRESEARKSAILESSLDCLIVMDHEGRIVNFNPAAERTFGYERDAVIGASLAETVIPERLRDAHRRGLEGALRTGEGKIFNRRVELSAMRADGSEFPCELTIVPSLQEGKPPFFTGFIRDISERKRAEALLDGQKRVFEMLATGAALTDVLAALVGIIEEQTEGLLGSILVRKQGDEHFHLAVAPSLPPRYAEALGRAPITPPYLGPCGMATHLSREVATADIASDPRWAGPWRDLASDLGLRTCYSSPILASDGSALGSFGLYSREPRDPRPPDRQLLETATHLAGIAIERRRAEENLRHSEERYRTLFESIDEGFCTIEVLFEEGGGPVDYRFLDVNPAFEAQTGLKDAVGKRMRELEPRHEAHWFETYGRIALTGEPERFTSRAEHLEDRWYDVYAFRIGRPEERKVAILFNDISQHKRAEEGLRHSEERYRVLTEVSPQIVWTADAEGMIDYSNQHWFDYSGLTMEQTAGSGWSSTIHPDHHERVSDEWTEAVRVGADYEVEVPFRRASDGAYRWHLVRGMPLSDISGHAVRWIGTAVDIDDRKRAEEALRESESHLRALFEQAAVGIGQVDLSGRYVLANERYCEIVGRSRDEMLGVRMQDISHPDELPKTLELFEGLAGGGENYTLEKRYIRPDHSEVWVRISVSAVSGPDGKPRYLVGVCQDITAQREVEEELKRSEQRYRTFADAVPDIGFISGKDGGAEYVNQRWHEYTGCSRQPRETEWVEATHPDDRERVIQAWRHAVAQGEPLEIEFRLRRRDGAYRWFLSRVLPLKDREGRLLRYFGTMSDIEDYKNAERQLRGMNETLEERVAERTAVAEQRAGQLQALAAELTQAEQRERRRLAEVLHDHLQQLLVGAQMGLGVVRHDVAGERTRDSLNQVFDLIGESIGVSRSLTVELSPPVLYDGGLGAAIEWLGRHMGEKHGLRVEADIGEGAEPETDDVRAFCFQAVRELLFNAIKHGETDRAALWLRGDGPDRVYIVVEDEGRGFDPGVIEGAASEVGFGLFSIRERLELLGGELRIDSGPGRGSRITLIVPRRLGTAVEAADTYPMPDEPRFEAPEERREAEEAEARDREEAPGRIRVVLADDHDILREGLVGLLTPEPDIEVVGEASDGQMALDLARELRPDVVVMDITMPRLTGIEATRRITEELDGIRIIGLSMHEADSMGPAMREAGAVAYLTKGGPSDMLIAVIRGESPLHAEG